MINITNDFNVTRSEQHIHVECLKSSFVLSSSVLNGGWKYANHIVNMNVPRRMDVTEVAEMSLEKYCIGSGWRGVCVGMMTAASMNSYRMKEERADGVSIAVLATVGLSHPRRAGDKADIQTMTSGKHLAGTINLIALTSGQLTHAAMTESIMIMSEAKAAALMKAEVVSPISNEIATGTGTDSIAIAAAGNSKEIAYCGKHLLFGEILGRLTIDALTDSLEWYNSNIKSYSAPQHK